MNQIILQQQMCHFLKGHLQCEKYWHLFQVSALNKGKEPIKKCQLLLNLSKLKKDALI